MGEVHTLSLDIDLIFYNVPLQTYFAFNITSNVLDNVLKKHSISLVGGPKWKATVYCPLI